MESLAVKSLETGADPQTKMMFWFLFSSSRGSLTRVRIVKLLQRQPYNTHKLSQELCMDYKAVKHHLKTLEKNKLIERFDANYGAAYFLTPLFEANQNVFAEIVSKL